MSVKWHLNPTSLLWAIIIIAGLLILAVTLCNRPVTPSQIPWTNIHTQLDSLDYTQADPVQHPILPDTVSVPEELVTSTTTGSGSWIAPEPINEGDTMAVKLSEVVLGDGTTWGKVTIDGKPVIWENLTHFNRPAELGKWSAGIETAILHDFDISLFISRNLFEIWNIRGGTAIAVDLNSDLSESPDWLALECRLSTPVWRSVEFGGGIGPMFMRDRIELYVSGGLEVRF